MFGTKKQISFAADLLAKAESFTDRNYFLPQKQSEIHQRRMDLIEFIRFVDGLENGLSGLTQDEFALVRQGMEDKNINLLAVIGKAPSGKLKVEAEKVISVFLHYPLYAIRPM